MEQYDIYLVARKRIDGSYKPMRNNHFDRIDAISAMRNYIDKYPHNKYVIMAYKYEDANFDYLGEI